MINSNEKIKRVDVKNVDSIANSVEKQLVLARKLGDVYGRRPEVSEFKGAMKGTKFESDYSAEVVAKDEKYVEEIRMKINESNSSLGRDILNKNESGFALSEMMQAMVVDQINKGWLEEFSAVMTSDYDDLKVGVDAVLKHKSGNYIGAAFDFTITSQEKFLEEKLKKGWEHSIEKGSIPVVKYFEDPDTHVKSRISTPKFVIGGTRQDIEEMAEAYITDNQEALKDHKFQYLMIEQVYEQLVTVLDYYENHDDKQFSFAKAQYEKVYTIIQRMRDRYSRENKINNLEFYQYSQDSVALQTMRRIKHLKETEDQLA